VAIRRGPNKGSKTRFYCKCDCGRVKLFYSCALKSLHMHSCGCSINTTHHLSNHPLYNCWQSMWARCTKRHNPSYKNYGGRGIKVCDRWRNVQNFITDMGEKPTPKHSIERKNNDGDYTPENCKWSTRIEQNRNSRKNVFILLNGQKKTLKEWATHLGISSSILSKRLKAQNGNTLDAFFGPFLEFNGKSQRLSEWAVELGISASILYGRLSRRWPIRRILYAPIQNPKTQHLKY
jgi:hypothetical protein